MKIWFDTEFYEDGRMIDLISIGMVREDGCIYYAESHESRFIANRSLWLRNNVMPHLSAGAYDRKKTNQIVTDLIEFAGTNPEFWAYYADYDWVVLCQLFGTMMQLPPTWPMFCMDVKQLCVMKGNPELPKQQGIEHNALSDAIWARQAWEFLMDIKT